MSDYLWDRKGDTDAEVARLEALLGAFAHEPRLLELPAEAAQPETAPTKILPFVSRLRASRLFKPSLAAAAALLVATVLIASAFLRARVASQGEHAATRDSAQPAQGTLKDQRTAPREVERGMLEPPPPTGGVGDRHKSESVAVNNLPNVARQKKAMQLAAAPIRRPKVSTVESVAVETRAGGGLTLETMSARDGASALVENTRLLTKEQLVYALRFTGAKLKDVRERAQGAKSSRQ